MSRSANFRPAAKYVYQGDWLGCMYTGINSIINSYRLEYRGGKYIEPQRLFDCSMGRLKSLLGDLACLLACLFSRPPTRTYERVFLSVRSPAAHLRMAHYRSGRGSVCHLGAVSQQLQVSRLHPNGLLTRRLLDVETKHQAVQISQPGKVPTLHHRLHRLRYVHRQRPNRCSDIPKRWISRNDFLVVVEQRNLPDLGPEAVVRKLFHESGEVLGWRVAVEADVQGGFDKKDLEEGEVGVFAWRGDSVRGGGGGDGAAG